MNNFIFKTPHGTAYNKPALVIENASRQINKLIDAGYKPFKQEIYFNPLSSTGNFKFRVRHWHWNKHIPATNTGRDVLNPFFIDYGDNSDKLYEIDPTNDRITGWYDYESLVNDHYNKCKEEYDQNPDMGSEEYYNKLFSFSVTVTFYIKSYEVTAGLYPDELESLHEQKLTGRIGRLYHDLEMNVLFPKLTKMSYDIFYNYTYFEKNLLRNCDRLLELDPRVFDTLVDQTTLESWFENSGVYRLSSRTFENMSKVETIKNMCRNSNLQELGLMTFNHLHYINNFKSAFYNSKLTQIGNDLFNIYSEAGDLFCESMFAEIPYQISKEEHCMKYLQTSNLVHSLNMWGNVISQISPESFMQGIKTDGYPINIIYTDVPSTDIENMDCMEFKYHINKDVELEELVLTIPSLEKKDATIRLEHSDQLTNKIIIEASFLTNKIAYDPNNERVFDVLPLLSHRHLKIGDMWIKIYSDKTNSDIIGLDFYTRNQHGDISRDFIKDEIFLTINGVLPKSPRIVSIERLYHELCIIENTKTFFSMYDKYEVPGLFADLPYFESLDEFLLNPLINNQSFEYLISNNKSIYEIGQIFKTNHSLRNLNGAFMGVRAYELDPNIFDTTPKLEYLTSTFENAKNLIINNTHLNLFKNTPNIISLDLTFQKCESLTSRVYISHLDKCVTFRSMYANCNGLLIREDQYWKNTTKDNDIIDKLGNLERYNKFSIPDYGQLETKPNLVDLSYMYYNINPSSIIMNPLIGSSKDTIYKINRMYSNIKSYFTDKYLFRNINIKGDSFVYTITPSVEYDIICDALTINFIPATKAYGIELLSNTSTQIKTAMNYNVFYPEIIEDEEIDVEVINHTKNITTQKIIRMSAVHASRQIFKRRKSKTGNENNKLKFIYAEDNPYYSEELEVPYHPINIQIEALILDEKIASIGDNITISVKNRFIPITIENQTIKDIKGEYPFSRVELLDLEKIKNIQLPTSLFKHMFLSTNISLVDDSFINNTYSEYIFKEEFDFEKIFPHLHTLNNFVINSPHLIGVVNNNINLFENANILQAKNTFLNNPSQISYYNIKSAIDMFGTYKGTSVLQNPINGIYPKLKYAKYVFENERSSSVYLTFNSPLLENITGIFKGSLLEVINENPFIGENIINANEMFMNSKLERYDHILDTHPVKYVDHILDGSSVKVITELVPRNTIISGNYAIANCNPEEINIDFIRKNISCISLHHLFYKTPIDASIDYIDGMESLMDASYILGDNKLSSISETFFKTNTNLTNLEGALYKHKMEIIPNNLLFGINNLKSLKRFTSQAENLKSLPNLGCMIKSSDTVFDFSEFADRCYKVDFLEKKFTDIIYPYDENNPPTINIQNSLNQIKVSYTDIELANKKFLIEGISNAIYVPSASVDITGLNALIISFTHIGEEEKLEFRVWDYTRSQMKQIKNATQLQRSNRCVIMINDKVYGLNKLLDNPINPQDFPKVNLIPNQHYTIKIYTEAYGNPQTMTNGEVLVIGNINNKDIETTLGGYLPIGPVKNSVRELNLRAMFGINVNLVDIYSLKFNNELYNDHIYVSSGYFKKFNFTKINLDNILFSPNHLVDMFEDCTKLQIVDITNPIILNGNGVNLTNFFKGCPISKFPIDKPLSYYFDILKNEGGFKIVNTPIKFNNMFEGCKLTKINKVLDLISTDENQITFPKPNLSKDLIIDFTNMYANSSISDISDGIINIQNLSYRSKHPSYIFDNMFLLTSIINIPKYAFSLDRVSNLTSFKNTFDSISTLSTLELPMINMCWYWDFMEYENDLHLEGLFRLSTNLAWKRITIHHLIEYCNDNQIPYSYYSYGMLENIISHNPDERIFRGVVFIGETLAIYEDIGPDIEGMNRFRMYFDMRKLISGDYLFRIYGPTNSNVGFTDLTNLNTLILNSKMHIVINDDLPNAIEYYPDESKTIQIVSVSTNDNEQRVLKKFNKSRDYQEEYETICLDIYTDNNPNEIEIQELLGCFRANQPSLVLGIRVEGSIGYSLKYKSRGLLLLDILGKDAKDKLYSIGEDLFNNYHEVGMSQSMDLDYNYGKSLLAGIKGCSHLGANIFKPFKDQETLIGILAETSFDTLDENIFQGLKVNRLIDLFANAKVPTNLNENHFIGVTCEDITGMFYKATNTNHIINSVLTHLTNVKTAKYLYALSDIKLPHTDMFRYLISLENNDFSFYKTMINSCPNIYNYNQKLNSVKSLFEGSKIEKISDKLLANKDKLQYVDSLLKDCVLFHIFPENVFMNSENIDSATYMAYNTPSLVSIPEHLLKSFRSCRYAKHMFDGSGIDIYPDLLLKSFSSLINGEYMFANNKNPSKIPNQFLSAFTSANSIKGIFSGDGNLVDCGVDVLPHSTSLENIQELFKYKRLIEKLDDDYFKYTPNIKHIDNYMNECSSLKKLPNISYLTNLETVSNSHELNTSLIEIPSRYYYNNRKIYKFDNAFVGDLRIKIFGEEIFNFDFSLNNEISLLSTFDGCSNINLHYDLIDKYITNTSEINADKKLKVENMFNLVKTFLDEAQVWEPLKKSKIGDSKLVPTDPPSFDINDMFYIGFKLIPSVIPMKQNYQLKTLHDMQLPKDTTSFKGRVVIYLDGNPLKAYDNNIYYGEVLEEIRLPDITHEHIIGIYTEYEDDLVVIHNAGEFVNTNLDDDDIIFKKEELPKIEITGGLNSGLSKLTNIRLIDILTILEPEQTGLQYIGYPIINITADIIKNVTNILPRKESVDGGFFSGLFCSHLPKGLITKSLSSPPNSLYEITEGLICKNPKLEEIPEDILSNLIFDKLTYFNAECLSLRKLNNFLPAQNTIKVLDYMCYKCISLLEIDDNFGNNLVDVSMNSFLEGCSKFNGFSNEFINNFNGKINSLNKFAYNSGYSLLNEQWIDLLENVISAKYAFANSKISEIPTGLFKKAIKLRTLENDSPIEGMFSNIPSLIRINGSLELLPSNRNLQGLFADSINLEWGNKRIFRYLYKTPPRTALIDDSFKNIKIPLDDDEQLFENINITGHSNAIFTGRIPPSTDTEGLSGLYIYFKLTSSSKLTLIPKIKQSLETIENLTDTSQIKNRLVFKIYKIDKSQQAVLYHEIGYDDNYEQDTIKPLLLENDLDNMYRIEIYTKDEYVGFDISSYLDTKIDGVFPLDILNEDDSITPIKDMFGLKVNNFGNNLLTNLNKTKLNLNNTPFNMREHLKSIGSLLNILTDQEILDYQFSGCINLKNDLILNNLTKLKSIRYLFKDCENLNLNITEFLKSYPEMEDITGFLENASYTNLITETFTHNPKLKYAKYFIKNTQTSLVPENLFKTNVDLVSIAGAFMNCPLIDIPITLGCNPGCYSIERVYFNCRTITNPLTRTVAELIYNGQPADTVKLVDAFYQVPVTFRDEGSFTHLIRFTQGSTGAIFNQKGGK